MSSYNLDHARLRRYFDFNLIITASWDDNKIKEFGVIYAIYIKAFNDMKIGFGCPSQNDCNLYLLVANHNECIKYMHDQSYCSECMDWKKCEEESKIYEKRIKMTIILKQEMQAFLL